MKKSALAIVIAGAIVVTVFLLSRQQASTPIPQVDTSSLRQTPSGEVIGFRDSWDTHAWLGIPYAEAPVGQLRWRAPQRARPWSGTRKALSYGSPCTQLWGPMSGVKDGEEGQVVGTEDCLYLNIWAPAVAAQQLPDSGEQLPVMVWIHGGGNTIGTANTYPGPHLAGGQQVVYVAINYRMGPLGWFSHKALRDTAGNRADASGNYGVLDMIAALEWVRDNIASFGGDPKNVTLFGESAGGRNVYALLGSPLAKGLFHRAISQSGSVQTTELSRAENRVDDVTPGEANSSGEVLVKLLLADGIASDRDDAIQQTLNMSSEEIRNYLYRKTELELYSIFDELGYGMFLAPQVFRDGYVIPTESLLQRFRDPGMYNSVPIIVGSNRDEQKSFMAQDPRFVERRFGLLPRVIDQANYDRITGYYSDQWKALAVDEPAEILSNSQGATVYAYRFDWDDTPSNWMADFPNLLGAGHGLEVSFVLGDFEGGISVPYLMNSANEAGREALSTSMMNYWAQFAYTGNPGRGRDGAQVRWAPWGDAGQTFIVLDTPEGGDIHMSKQRVTAQALKTRLAEDSLFDNAEQRCRLYVELFLLSYQSTDFWSQDEYHSLDDGACRQFSPYDFDEQP